MLTALSVSIFRPYFSGERHQYDAGAVHGDFFVHRRKDAELHQMKDLIPHRSPGAGGVKADQVVVFPRVVAEKFPFGAVGQMDDIFFFKVGVNVVPLVDPVDICRRRSRIVPGVDRVGVGDDVVVPTKCVTRIAKSNSKSITNTLCRPRT